MDEALDMFDIDDVMPYSAYFQTDTKSFKEFDECLNELDILVDAMADDNELYEPVDYTEAVEDTNIHFRNTLRDTARSTFRTTRDLVHSYGKITSASAGAIKSLWDLAMKLIDLIVRVSTFIINKITSIPKAIIRFMNFLGNIPARIRAKIKGDITLYITVEDLNTLYGSSLMPHINNYMHYLDRLVGGDFFGTSGIGNKRKAKIINHGRRGSAERGKIHENDIQLCGKMEREYEELKGVKFNKSIVNMSNQSEVDTYFGNAKIINLSPYVRDRVLKGQKAAHLSYYEALNQLMSDIKDHQETIAKLQEALGNKYKRSLQNDTFAELSRKEQNIVLHTLRSISKMISLIGNIVKYVIKDLNTLDKASKKIEEHAADHVGDPNNTSTTDPKKIQKWRKAKRKYN